MMTTTLRHDWDRTEIHALFDMPFNDLIFNAQTLHRQHFDPNAVQTSKLLNFKTGACPEDCAYCPQSGHYDTGLEKEKTMPVAQIVEAAKAAKQKGATRFCMGGAWRHLFDHDLQHMVEMIKQVKTLGMETCLTVGMLTSEQASALKAAGLDFYNHNLDTSPEFYEKIITTRCYQDRLDTLKRVRQAGIKVCCGGIMGLGESREDRVGLLHQLATLPEHPESVPINMLMRAKGTPLEDAEPLDPIEFVRTIAVAKILMPQSFVRLSAGRTEMSDEMQALCFLAGANSIFIGDKLLTLSNPGEAHDNTLFEKLGIKAMKSSDLNTAHA